MEELQGDRTPNRDLRRLEDDPEAALAEQPLEPVASLEEFTRATLGPLYQGRLDGREPVIRAGRVGGSLLALGADAHASLRAGRVALGATADQCPQAMRDCPPGHSDAGAACVVCAANDACWTS